MPPHNHEPFRELPFDVEYRRGRARRRWRLVRNGVLGAVGGAVFGWFVAEAIGVGGLLLALAALWLVVLATLEWNWRRR